HLLLDPFKDENVRVDRHTHCEHNPCNTGQRKRGGQRWLREYAQDEEDVERKRNVRYESTSGVISDHKDYDQRKAADNGNQPLFQGLFTEGRSNNTFLNDCERSRERSGAQYVGQVFRFFNGEVSGDLRVAVGNFTLYIGCRIYGIVENDGDPSLRLPAGCVGRHLRPHLCPGGVHRHADGIATVLINFVPCVGDRLTGQFGFTGAAYVQEVQFEHRLLGQAVPVHFFGLIAPVHANISRQEILNSLTPED